MVELARGFMVFVDVITFLLGIAILGLTIYVVVDYSSFGTLVSFDTIYISIAVGVALIIVSIIGCIASQKGYKHLLCCYLFIVTAALAAQIAGTVLISRYAGQIDKQNKFLSGSITDAADRELNNAILSTYVACCIGCPAEQACTNIRPYYNLTLGNCFANNNTVCDPVPTCGVDPNQDGCFINPGTSIPPVNIDEALCNTFKTFKNGTDIALVGPATTGSCGGGDPNTYLNDVVDYFNSGFYWFIVGFGILCGIQALNLIAALFVLCCIDDRARYK